MRVPGLYHAPPSRLWLATANAASSDKPSRFNSQAREEEEATRKMTTTTGILVTTILGAVVLTTLAASADAQGCNNDAVQAGDLCVDRYEASVWETTDSATITEIKGGEIQSGADLSLATQRGAAGDDYGAACPDDAAGCLDHYAVSIPGVAPSNSLTWFQAAAACRNSGKRLLTNAEWQAAALGTPDTGGADDGVTTCNTDSTFAIALTGSRSACISDVGAFDMVGNVFEWVADWVPRSTACPGWGGFSDDAMCLAGAETASGPDALRRGGFFQDGTDAGPFSVEQTIPNNFGGLSQGFRCARTACCTLTLPGTSQAPVVWLPGAIGAVLFAGLWSIHRMRKGPREGFGAQSIDP